MYILIPFSAWLFRITPGYDHRKVKTGVFHFCIRQEELYTMNVAGKKHCKTRIFLFNHILRTYLYVLLNYI